MSSPIDNANTQAIADIIAAAAILPNHHATSGPVWRLWNDVARRHIPALFKTADTQPVLFGPFDTLTFPYVEMGNINSLDLFGLDELIIFAFYNANRARYRKVVDFGANIGLHTFVMGRCGFSVRSFEPDPVHIELLNRTLKLNNIEADLHETAISIEPGQLEFVRVLGNTTGSHLAGAKDNPYGDLERFDVTVEAALPHLEWADLAKMDIEGHEAVLLDGLPTDIWLQTDAIMEVGTPVNAQQVFKRFSGTKVNMFAQKIGWQKVTSVDDMPTSHRDGSLFLSGKSAMPW